VQNTEIKTQYHQKLTKQKRKFNPIDEIPDPEKLKMGEG
jgi:hypothetical protein